jgi:hypothetical protein
MEGRQGAHDAEGNHATPVESRAYTMGPAVHHHGDISHEPAARTRALFHTTRRRGPTTTDKGLCLSLFRLALSLIHCLSLTHT